MGKKLFLLIMRKLLKIAALSSDPYSLYKYFFELPRMYIFFLHVIEVFLEQLDN